MQVEAVRARPIGGLGPIQIRNREREAEIIAFKHRQLMAQNLGSVDQRVDMAKSGRNLKRLAFDQDPRVLRQLVESLGDDRTIARAGITTEDARGITNFVAKSIGLAKNPVAYLGVASEIAISSRSQSAAKEVTRLFGLNTAEHKTQHADLPKGHDKEGSSFIGMFLRRQGFQSTVHSTASGD